MKIMFFGARRDRLVWGGTGRPVPPHVYILIHTMGAHNAMDAHISTSINLHTRIFCVGIVRTIFVQVNAIRILQNCYILIRPSNVYLSKGQDGTDVIVSFKGQDGTQLSRFAPSPGQDGTDAHFKNMHMKSNQNW